MPKFSQGHILPDKCTLVKKTRTLEDSIELYSLPTFNTETLVINRLSEAKVLYHFAIAVHSIT